MKSEINRAIMAKIESRLFDTSFNSVLARGNVAVRAAAMESGQAKKVAEGKTKSYQPQKAGFPQIQE